VSNSIHISFLPSSELILHIGETLKNRAFFSVAFTSGLPLKEIQLLEPEFEGSITNELVPIWERMRFSRIFKEILARPPVKVENQVEFKGNTFNTYFSAGSVF